MTVLNPDNIPTSLRVDASGRLLVTGSGGGGGDGISEAEAQDLIDDSLVPVNAHVASTANPHAVTKAQVGLANADNTADSAKSVASAATLTTPRNINGTAFNGSADITVTAAAGTLTGTTLNSSVVTSSITALGANVASSGNELGYRNIVSASVTTGAFVNGDRGRVVLASGGVTIPNSVMQSNSVVTIVNTTGSPITLTAAIATLRQAGTANTGDRTLAGYGVAVVLFLSGTNAIISGDGLT